MKDNCKHYGIILKQKTFKHCLLAVLPGSVLNISTMKMFRSGVDVEIHPMLQTCLVLLKLREIMSKLISIRPSSDGIQHM